MLKTLSYFKRCSKKKQKQNIKNGNLNGWRTPGHLEYHILINKNNLFHFLEFEFILLIIVDCLEIVFFEFFSRFRLWAPLLCADRWTSRPSWRWWRRGAISTWPTGRCCRRSPESGRSRPPEDTSGTTGAARGRVSGVGEAKERMRKREREGKKKKKRIITKYAKFTSVTITSNSVLLVVTSHWIYFFILLLINFPRI